MAVVTRSARGDGIKYPLVLTGLAEAFVESSILQYLEMPPKTKRGFCLRRLFREVFIADNMEDTCLTIDLFVKRRRAMLMNH